MDSNAENKLLRWSELIKFGYPARYRRNSDIFVQDVSVHEMFLLSTGVVKRIRILADGRQTLLDLRHRGQWLEESSVIHQYRHCSSATALTPCELYRCDIREFRSAIANNQQASRLFALECAEEMRMQLLEVSFLKLLDAEERLERFIAHCAAKLSDNVLLVHLPLRDHEIASLIGVSKQHVSSLKRQLLASGRLVLVGNVLALPTSKQSGKSGIKNA